MSDKLGIGDTFPDMTLGLVGGGSMDLPGGLDTKYKVILFYRGHWWPYCRRQLVGFAEQKAELDKIDVSIVAASIDTGEESSQVADEVNFPPWRKFMMERYPQYYD